MELPWLQRWQPQLLALLRIVAGLLFLEHATQKFFAFPAPFPVQPVPALFLTAGVVELVAGTLITLGLFTRMAAFVASGEMAIGYFMIHFPQGFWPAVTRAKRRSCFALCSCTSPAPVRARGAWTAGDLDRACLGDPGSRLEARLVPFVVLQDFGQNFGCPNHVDEAIVERRETEAHEVWSAEVADHAAGDQRL